MKLYACVFCLAAVALFWPASGMRWAPAIARWLDTLGKHRRACVLGIAVLSLLTSFGWNLVLKTPAPRVHDEFGYLLEADTFAHGRLKNPTPPMWTHFETFHEFFQPAYMSKFPPAQGAALALGQLIAKPITGVWLTTAFAYAAILWMLLAWLPPRWALPVSLLLLLNPAILMWNWMYWGGSIALGAGALVLGSYRRLADPACHESRISTGILAGIGMGLLALSRPYEGFVLSVTVIALLLFDLARTRRLSGLWAAAAPAVAMVALAGGFILFYNKSITGHALLMPYVLYERTYDAAPLFLWQKLPPIPGILPSAMHDFYLGARAYAGSQQTLAGFCHAAWGKLLSFGPLFWDGAALIFLAAAPLAVRRDPWLWRAGFILLASAGAIAFSNYVFPHYVAPALPLVFVLLGVCMQRVWRWKLRNRPAGAFFVTAMVLLLALYAASFFYIRQSKNQNGANWGYWRNQIISGLARDGHKHLVLIRYSSGHDLNQEWVYNAAELDGAPILWARDLGPERNRELLDYYKDRAVWLFNPDTDAKPQACPRDTASKIGEGSI